MKSMFKFFLGAAILLAASFNTASAQTPNTDTTLIVNGVCDMCKKTIETAALKSGAAKAFWDENTKVLKLTYNADKTSLDEIDAAIRKTGYDTESAMAKEKDYNQLHDCCKYRDPAVMDAHKKEK